MSKTESNIFKAINGILDHLKQLENRIDKMERKNELSMAVLQSHLMRIKNGQRLPDDFVLNRRQYLDLTPKKAFEIYEDPDQDFVLLDVSELGHESEIEFPEAVKIPLEELGARHFEIASKKTSVLVISEDGTRSILACELLNSQGFYNVNNISGGYKYWPAQRIQAVS